MTARRRYALAAAALGLSGWCSCKREAPPAPPPYVPPSLPTPQHAAPGVAVWPGLLESASDDLALGWIAPWLNGTLLLEDGHVPSRAKRSLVNCADLDGVQESDVQLGPQWERDVFKEKSVRCRALSLVRRATTPRLNYLADLVSSNDPGDALPAALSLGPVMKGETRSWRAVDRPLSFDRAAARPNYRELVVRGKYEGVLTWWASGDFNGDGVADAVLFLDLARTADLNLPNVRRAFVITRLQPGGPVTILQRFD